MAAQTTESNKSTESSGTAKSEAVKAKRDDRSIGAVAGEFKDLAIAYAKQETVDPLKSLVRFVLWGVVGAILISLGAGLLVLAGVRAAQAEAGNHLSGSLTWVPYVGGLLIALVFVGAAVARIAKGGPR